MKSVGLWRPYQIFARTSGARHMGASAGILKASKNSWRFTWAPIARNRPGLCGSTVTRRRSSASRVFVRHTWDSERKNRCSGMRPSIETMITRRIGGRGGSLVTVHTWPEHGYAAVDLFYCGGTVRVHKAVEVLQKRFQPERIKFLVVRRGLQSEVRK